LAQDDPVLPGSRAEADFRGRAFQRFLNQTSRNPDQFVIHDMGTSAVKQLASFRFSE
jgi:hypothetical protein